MPLNIYTTTLTLLDPGNDPITGATITVVTFDGPNGSVSPSLVAIEELPNGVYELTIGPLALPGPYSLTVQADDAWSQVFSETWEQADHINAITVLATGTTRKEMRRRVARKIGDFKLFTATANGTTTTFIDQDRIYGEPGRFAAREAFLSGGTAANLGQLRYIKASSRDNSLIQFARALPQATKIGDECEVMGAYGIGITFEDVNSSLDEAIRVAQGYARIPASVELTDPYDGETTFTLAVPDEFVGISGLQYFDDVTGQWKDLAVANRLGADGWYADPTTRTITLQGDEGYRVRGSRIRLYGLVIPQMAVADDDVIYVDGEWFVAYAASFCLLDVIQSRQIPGDWSSKGLMYRQDADRVRTRLIPNFPPNYRGL